LQPVSDRSIILAGQREQMAHAVALGPQVRQVMQSWTAGQGQPLHHFGAAGSQAFHLVRVIGEQAHARDAQVLDDARRGRIGACIGGQAELKVGLHRVTAHVLE
jgi:hypothetical protein